MGFRNSIVVLRRARIRERRGRAGGLGRDEEAPAPLLTDELDTFRTSDLVACA